MQFISIHGGRTDRAYFMTDDTFWSLGVQLHWQIKLKMHMSYDWYSPISVILIITRKLEIEGYSAFFEFLHFIIHKWISICIYWHDFRLKIVNDHHILIFVGILWYYKYINSWNSFWKMKKYKYAIKILLYFLSSFFLSVDN